MSNPPAPLDAAVEEAREALGEIPPNAEDTRITSLIRCAKALRSLLAALREQAPATCPDCNGTGSVDAGAFVSGGEICAATEPCHCSPAPAPPADAATEAVRMLRHLCNVYGCTSYGRTPDHGPDDCSWCEAEALLAALAPKGEDRG